MISLHKKKELRFYYLCVLRQVFRQDNTFHGKSQNCLLMDKNTFLRQFHFLLINQKFHFLLHQILFHYIQLGNRHSLMLHPFGLGLIGFHLRLLDGCGTVQLLFYVFQFLHRHILNYRFTWLHRIHSFLHWHLLFQVHEYQNSLIDINLIQEINSQIL